MLQFEVFIVPAA